MSPLRKAIDLIGWQPLAASLGVSRPAIHKWDSANRLPRTEFSGETNWAEKIEAATDGQVAASDLIEWSREGWNRKAA